MFIRELQHNKHGSWQQSCPIDKCVYIINSRKKKKEDTDVQNGFLFIYYKLILKIWT